jgi:hypothetical protein
VDIIKALSSTPIPTLLVVAGLIFLSFAFINVKKPIVIELKPEDRKHARIIGGIVLAVGVILYVFPVLLNGAKDGNVSIALATSTLTASPTPEAIHTSTHPPTPTRLTQPLPKIEVQKLDLPFSSRDDLPPKIIISRHIQTAGKTNFTPGNDLFVWVIVCAQKEQKRCTFQELHLLASGEWESPIDVGDDKDDCVLFDLYFSVVSTDVDTKIRHLNPFNTLENQVEELKFEDSDVFTVIRGYDESGEPLETPCP